MAKEFCKLLHICQSCDQTSNVLFFTRCIFVQFKTMYQFKTIWNVGAELLISVYVDILRCRDVLQDGSVFHANTISMPDTLSLYVVVIVIV